MNVEELIKELKKLNPKATIMYKHGRTLCPIQKVEADKPIRDWAIITSDE